MLLLKKLRWKSVFNNSFKTYLKYAIGEVVLIVIGVLIAVSINQCTTDRNNIANRNEILSKVLDDFKKDEVLAKDIRAFYKKREPIFLGFINETITIDSLKTCNDCQYLISGFRLLRPNLEGFNALKTNVQNLTITNNVLSSFVNSYVIKLDELNHQQDNLINDVNKNLEYWRDNYEWFTEFFNGDKSETYLMYQLSSDYRNKVTYHYSLYYNNYLVKVNELTELQKRFDTIVNELKD